MLSHKTATLYLAHGQISSDNDAIFASNSTGSHFSNGKQTSTWTLDMHKVLGSTYVEGGEYQLRLNSFSHLVSEYWTLAQEPNALVFMQLSGTGISFVNCNYDVKSNSLSNSAILTTRYIANDTCNIVDYAPNQCIATIRISQRMVDFTISFIRTSDLQPVEYDTNPMPHMSFAFDLVQILEA